MEDSKRLVSMFVEKLWNERKLELADAIFHEDCRTHQLRSGSPATPVPRGPAEIKTHVADWLSAFPDLRFTIEQIFAEGDRVFSQLAMDGTHTGQWLGISPTGKRVNIRMVTIHRIRSGRIIEDWVLVESLGVFQQLGALPPTKDFIAAFARRQSV
jgi:steroid delta-isomerase-like uncharacterized protein